MWVQRGVCINKETTNFNLQDCSSIIMVRIILCVLVLPYNAPSDILQAAQVDSFRHARSGSLSSGSDTGSSDGGHNRPKMKSAVMQVRCPRLTLCVFLLHSLYQCVHL